MCIKIVGNDCSMVLRKETNKCKHPCNIDPLGRPTITADRIIIFTHVPLSLRPSLLFKIA